MDGERFLNYCFFAHETTHPHTIKPTKNVPKKKYEDPKLNAECKVEICRIPKHLEKLYYSGKPIHLDSGKWQTKIARKKKQQRKKVPIEGTKRLLRQEDSDEDEEKHTDAVHADIDLNAQKKSSEFVAERSLHTPEGLRVLQRTTSSKENENIKSLIEFKESPIEEVTISSDEEENLTPPPNCSLDAESNANIAECNIPSMPSLSNFILPATKDEEKELPEDTDEKLRNIVNRIKPNEKSTKLTTPKPLISGRGKAISKSKRLKNKKSNSIRNQLQKDPNWTSYTKSVKDANQRNDSHTTCASFHQSVSTVGNKGHDSIPTHKPSFPTPVPVKAKSTTTSRNDKLTEDFIKSKDMPIKEKKEPKTKRFSDAVIPHNKTNNKKSVVATESSKRKRQQHEATGDLVRKNDSVPKETSPSFKPPIKRVGRNIERQPTQRPTASIIANRALNTAIPNYGRSRDGSYGTKRPLC